MSEVASTELQDLQRRLSNENECRREAVAQLETSEEALSVETFRARSASQIASDELRELESQLLGSRQALSELSSSSELALQDAQEVALCRLTEERRAIETAEARIEALSVRLQTHEAAVEVESAQAREGEAASMAECERQIFSCEEALCAESTSARTEAVAASSELRELERRLEEQMSEQRKVGEELLSSETSRARCMSEVASTELQDLQRRLSNENECRREAVAQLETSEEALSVETFRARSASQIASDELRELESQLLGSRQALSELSSSSELALQDAQEVALCRLTEERRAIETAEARIEALSVRLQTHEAAVEVESAQAREGEAASMAECERQIFSCEAVLSSAKQLVRSEREEREDALAQLEGLRAELDSTSSECRVLSATASLDKQEGLRLAATCASQESELVSHLAAVDAESQLRRNAEEDFANLKQASAKQLLELQQSLASSDVALRSAETFESAAAQRAEEAGTRWKEAQSVLQRGDEMLVHVEGQLREAVASSEDLQARYEQVVQELHAARASASPSSEHSSTNGHIHRFMSGGAAHAGAVEQGDVQSPSAAVTMREALAIVSEQERALSLLHGIASADRVRLHGDPAQAADAALVSDCASTVRRLRAEVSEATDDPDSVQESCRRLRDELREDLYHQGIFTQDGMMGNTLRDLLGTVGSRPGEEMHELAAANGRGKPASQQTNTTAEPPESPPTPPPPPPPPFAMSQVLGEIARLQLRAATEPMPEILYDSADIPELYFELPATAPLLPSPATGGSGSFVYVLDPPDLRRISANTADSADRVDPDCGPDDVRAGGDDVVSGSSTEQSAAHFCRRPAPRRAVRVTGGVNAVGGLVPTFHMATPPGSRCGSPSRLSASLTSLSLSGPSQDASTVTSLSYSAAPTMRLVDASGVASSAVLSSAPKEHIPDDSTPAAGGAVRTSAGVLAVTKDGVQQSPRRQYLPPEEPVAVSSSSSSRPSAPKTADPVVAKTAAPVPTQGPMQRPCCKPGDALHGTEVLTRAAAAAASAIAVSSPRPVQSTQSQRLDPRRISPRRPHDQACRFPPAPAQQQFSAQIGHVVCGTVAAVLQPMLPQSATPLQGMRKVQSAAQVPQTSSWQPPSNHMVMRQPPGGVNVAAAPGALLPNSGVPHPPQLPLAPPFRTPLLSTGMESAPGSAEMCWRQRLLQGGHTSADAAQHARPPPPQQVGRTSSAPALHPAKAGPGPGQAGRLGSPLRAERGPFAQLSPGSPPAGFVCCWGGSGGGGGSLPDAVARPPHEGSSPSRGIAGASAGTGAGPVGHRDR